jgi:phage pi2 protein 07
MKKNSLKDRLKKDYESKDRGAGSRPSAMDWKKIDDVKFFKPKEGKNIIDIVPYIIKTKNDPLVKTGDAKVGDQSYMLDLFIHSNIGPTQASIICLKETFGKPCPICEQRQAFYNEGKKDEAAVLKAKRQCFYNVRDVKNASDEIQVFNISHFLFQKELIEEAKASSDDGGIVDFVDLDDGKSISFRAAETESLINGKTVKFLEYKSFSFKDREDPLDESWVKKAVAFDELMKLHTYDEAKKILFGDEDEDTDSDDDEDEKPKAKGKTKGHPVEDDEEEEDVDDDDDSDDEEDTDESDEDEDEESDEDDEDDEPAPKPKAKAKVETKKPSAKLATGKSITTMKCPSKHKFGIDCNKFPDDCDDCDIWADCAKEQKKLKAKG